MHQTQSLPCIILRITPYGNSDAYVHAFSESQGRISLRAKGFRNSRKRFAGIVDLFSHVILHVQTTRYGTTLQHADAHDMRLNLRQDLKSLTRAGTLVRLFTHLIPENDAHPTLYTYINRALDLLNQHNTRDAVRIYPYLLKHAGIWPDVSQCNICGSTQLLAASLKASTHTIACARCTSAHNQTHLSPVLMRGFLGQPLPTEEDADAFEELVQEWALAILPR